MASDPEAIRLLRSIDASLQHLVALMEGGRGPVASSAGGHAIASDRDLDGQYGDPEVRKDPRDWKGVTMKGRRMSECPPDFLDLLAGFFDWAAGQADSKKETTSSGKPVGDFRRADAARARGWAKRIREGKVHQAPAGPPPMIPTSAPWAPVSEMAANFPAMEPIDADDIPGFQQ